MGLVCWLSAVRLVAQAHELLPFETEPKIEPICENSNVFTYIEDSSKIRAGRFETIFPLLKILHLFSAGSIQV